MIGRRLWSDKRRLTRVLLVVILTLPALALAWGVTFMNVWNRIDPAMASYWWSDGAQPRALLAMDIIKANPSPAQLAHARELSEGALLREPVNVAAARNLGMIAAAQRDAGRAERLFRYSESLSRRDAITQLWLLEAASASNDIDRTLRHYDRALRTSRGLYDLLLPILVRASSEPAIARSIAQLVAGHPPWWRDFANKLFSDGTSPAAIAEISRALRLDMGDAADRFLAGAAITRVAGLGAHELAWAMYRSAKGGALDPNLLRDGEFETELRVAPFDWRLLDQNELSAVAEPSAQGGRGRVLNLYSSGTSGEVARQMLLLGARRYRLSLMAGNIEGDETARPTITLACAGRSDTLLTLRLPVAPPGGARVEREFAIPAGCAAQWIMIGTGAGDRAAAPPWIDAVSIRPI